LPDIAVAGTLTIEKTPMKRTIGILATSVAVGALCLATDVPAMAKGPGGGGGGFHMGGGGGGGFHMGGGGFHPSFGGGGFHGFGGVHSLGGFHGFAAHGPMHMGRSFSPHGFSAHAFHGHVGHGFASHTIHGGRHFANHNLGHHEIGNHLANHGLENANNALEHNRPNGLNENNAHHELSHEQLTHNQLAGRNFHGLENFNKTGFNRNAFGDNARWNHWGGRFWGAGWNNWGGGWGGWAGPIFWPFLLGDVLTFILWPYDYYDPFWAYGPEFIFASIFAPGPYFGLDYGYGPDYYGPDYGYAGLPSIYYNNYQGGGGGGRSVSSRSAATAATTPATTDEDRQALAETNTAAVESCTGLAPGVTNLPVDQIRQTVHPTADQQTMLDELNTASSKASDVIKASCPTSVPLTPVGRLDAAEQRLQATVKAIQIVSSPLERFYDSLSDGQKQQFNAMNASGRSGGSAGNSSANLAALCSQQSGGFINLPVQRIEQVVAPTSQQQNAFDDLKKAAQNASDQLQSSCPTAVPQSPVARLETIQTRLSAMADAIKSVRPSLANFYASLNDEQKAKFNMMGPPLQSSSQAQSQGRGQE
jgi:LTXXQ motif family protein